MGGRVPGTPPLDPPMVPLSSRCAAVWNKTIFNCNKCIITLLGHVMNSYGASPFLYQW